MLGDNAMNNDITQWEYKSIEYRPREEKNNEELNKLGAQGWEATGTISNPGGHTVLLKRPRQPQPDYNYSR